MLPSPGSAQMNCPSTIRICANCTQKHNVFFRGCPVYKFESEVAALRFKRDPTLKEACLSGFQQVPLSLSASKSTPLGAHLAGVLGS